ncbi:MAG: S41 family peptidase [Marinilabiliaceae bacterium]|nr:S41 family peptidase [Marinilabiliaceae bacterium]
MKKIKIISKSTIVVAVGLLLLVVTGFVSSPDARNFEIVKNLDIFYSLFRELNSYYVDDIEPEKLIHTGIEAMLESLDPYTNFFPESDVDDLRFMTTGEYAGIGAIITKRGKYVVISEPYEGFPAHEAGLRAGDRIIEINGENMIGGESTLASEKLKGPAQTQVKLKIERPGTKGNIDLTITRRLIHISSVPYYGMLDKETGIIIFSNFTVDCTQEVENAFNDLKNNHNMKNLVLDMRGNPGGVMDEAIKVANLFLPRGIEIVSTKGKVSQWDKTYRSPKDPLDLEMPIIVLISRGSASSSEIVAGALQDYDRAVIIGQRSFGKGLVQTPRNLAYNAKLKITTAKYYIPSGRCIQAVDYSHRNEDGSVGYIPDSLINEFQTKGGRPVFDGGGITPDIDTPVDNYPNLVFALVFQQTFFDFVTEYAINQQSIPTPDKFILSDDVYQQFKEYVVGLPDFKYQSESKEQLKKLTDMAKKEGYYDKLQESFEILESGLKPNVERDMDIFKTEVSELLSIELIKRYYYQKGAILFSLKDDKEVDFALETFADKEKYRKILISE